MKRNADTGLFAKPSVIIMPKSLKAITIFLLFSSTVFLAGCKKDVGTGDSTWHKLVGKNQVKIDVGGYSLNAVDMGTGEPVVMIHGFADSSYCYFKNVQVVLDAGYRVILPEQPGLGKSDVPPQPYIYSVENQAEAIRILLDRMGIERFVLVGHSMGGGIALYLATKYPERINRLMVIDCTCYEPNGIRFLSLPGASYVARVFAGKWLIRSALDDVFYDDDKVTEAMVSEYAQPLAKPGYMDVLSGLSGQYFSEEFVAMAKSYTNLGVPLDVVWGDHDEWLPSEFGKKLASVVPNAKFHLLKDAGHNPHQEQPEIFNNLLVAAIKRGEYVIALSAR